MTDHIIDVVKQKALADLARSGITEEQAEVLGIQYLTQESTRNLSGLDFPSYKIPYSDNLYRLRLLSKEAGFGGAIHTPQQRYWQPSGVIPEVYMVPGFNYESERLIVTEGEKKAAAACFAGLPTVGIGGVWNFKSKKHGIQLLPQLSHLVSQIEEYEIVPDGDFRTNLAVRQAVIAHAEAVMHVNPSLKVTMVELPDDGDSKVGLDDYLLLPEADYYSLPRKELTRLEIAGARSWEKSDRGAAEAALFTFKDLKYIRETDTFIEFTDNGWVMGDDYSARRRVHQVNEARILNARDTIEDVKVLEKQVNYLTGLNNMNRSQAIINAWKERREIRSDVNDWDDDPFLLGCQNGVVDLTDGSLRPFRHADKVSLRARVNYDPSARCPIFLQTLDEIFQGDREMVAFLQRWYGYTISGDTTEQKFMIQIGRGRNGKSLLNDTIAWILGDYAASTSFDTFTTGRFNNDSIKNSALAQMVGRRMVTAAETRDTKYLDTSAIKTVTGDSLIQAKELYQSVFTYKFTGKIVLTTNHAPQVRDDSEGIWERLLNVKFGRIFSPTEIDRQRMAKLKEEAAGILNWLVEGCMDWQMHGLAIPDEVRGQVQEWRDAEDTLLDFANERLEFGDTFAPIADVFEAYKDYCEQDNRPTAWGKAYFSTKLRERFPQIGVNSRYRPPNGQRSASGRVNQITILTGVRCQGGSVQQNLDNPAGAVDRPADPRSTDQGE